MRRFFTLKFFCVLNGLAGTKPNHRTALTNLIILCLLGKFNGLLGSIQRDLGGILQNAILHIVILVLLLLQLILKLCDLFFNLFHLLLSFVISLGSGILVVIVGNGDGLAVLFANDRVAGLNGGVTVILQCGNGIVGILSGATAGSKSGTQHHRNKNERKNTCKFLHNKVLRYGYLRLKYEQFMKPLCLL